MFMFHFFFLSGLSVVLLTSSVLSSSSIREMHVEIKADLPKQESELSRLDALLGALREELSALEKLRHQLVDYEQLLARYHQEVGETGEEESMGFEQKELLHRMARKAHEIMKTIRAYQLAPSFSEDFLRELSLFDAMGSRQAMPLLQEGH